MNRQLGVCSWSLRPQSPEELATLIASAGVRTVQLALDPIRTRGEGGWNEAATRTALDRAGITILSGMMGTKGEDYSTLDSIKRTGGVRPDSTWPDNLAAAKANATIAKRMGINLVTFHAGFLPHDRNDPERRTMLDRLRAIADTFAAANIRIALETGQESADTLLEVLDDLDRPTIGVNFDPANMILYGMGDPIAAVQKLAPRITQFHIKDATPAKNPGEWGEEVPAGTGAVRWPDFFVAIRDIPGDLIIEREAGESRIADVIKARELVERLCRT